MIVVDNLTKRYGKKTAVDRLTFVVDSRIRRWSGRRAFMTRDWDGKIR